MAFILFRIKMFWVMCIEHTHLISKNNYKDAMNGCYFYLTMPSWL